MKKKYEQVDFSLFTEEAEAADIQTMTAEEKERVLKNFYDSIGMQSGEKPAEDAEMRRNRRRGLVAAACACLVLCTAFTPIGEKAWAAAKEALMGIGEFLGMSRQDSYATEVNQTQSRNGITVTLHEVTASDRQMRYTFSTECEDGRKLGDSKVGIGDVYINGARLGYDIPGTGTGPFGSLVTKPEEHRGMHYFSSDYINYEMPLNPEIIVEIGVLDERFTFTFTLKNEAFKEATREIPINRDVPYKDRVLRLGKLVITPIDQVITVKNPEEFDLFEDNIYLFCTDNHGHKSYWTPSFDYYFYGSRWSDRPDSQKTYELCPDAETYTIGVGVWDMNGKGVDPENPIPPDERIAEDFIIKIPVEIPEK